MQPAYVILSIEQNKRMKYDSTILAQKCDIKFYFKIMLELDEIGGTHIHI
jgi:hypothetical protein